MKVTPGQYVRLVSGYPKLIWAPFRPSDMPKATLSTFFTMTKDLTFCTPVSVRQAINFVLVYHRILVLEAELIHDCTFRRLELSWVSVDPADNAVLSSQMQGHRLQQLLDAVPANLNANANEKKR
jgi:hypothetical protein